VARRPDDHALAEVEGPVVLAAPGDRADGEIGPLRKLRGDQPAGERCVDLHA